MISNDHQVEQEIKAKGLTAPRITQADIEDNIVGVHFFTAMNGRSGAIKDGVYAGQERAQPYNADLQPLKLLTFCVLVLENGFTVTGESACASPENFDAEIGRKIARQNAVAKVWPLMGYELRSKLAAAPVKRINICGVDCKPGDSECNGYCIGKASHARLIGSEEETHL